jgi:hypothetical protein
MFVSDLLLDESRVQPSLNEMGDVAPSHRMEIQPVVQSECLPVSQEPGVEPLAADPRAPFRRPRGEIAAEPRTAAATSG